MGLWNSLLIGCDQVDTHRVVFWEWGSQWGCVQIWLWVCWWQCSHVWDQWLMQTLLSKGGDLPSIDDLGQPALLLLQWVKTDQALLMLFSSGTLQVGVGHSGDPQTPVGRRPAGDCWPVLDLVCHSPNARSSCENSCGCRMLLQCLELLVAACPPHGGHNASVGCFCLPQCRGWRVPALGHGAGMLPGRSGRRNGLRQEVWLHPGS